MKPSMLVSVSPSRSGAVGLTKRGHALPKKSLYVSASPLCIFRICSWHLLRSWSATASSHQRAPAGQSAVVMASSLYSCSFLCSSRSYSWFFLHRAASPPPLLTHGQKPSTETGTVRITRRRRWRALERLLDAEQEGEDGVEAAACIDVALEHEVRDAGVVVKVHVRHRHLERVQVLPVVRVQRRQAAQRLLMPAHDTVEAAEADEGEVTKHAAYVGRPDGAARLKDLGAVVSGHFVADL